MALDGIRVARGFRWWHWGGRYAHARRAGMRNHVALCGERLDPRACYALPLWPSCPRCEALTGCDPLAALEAA